MKKRIVYKCGDFIDNEITGRGKVKCVVDEESAVRLWRFIHAEIVQKIGLGWGVRFEMVPFPNYAGEPVYVLATWKDIAAFLKLPLKKRALKKNKKSRG